MVRMWLRVGCGKHEGAHDENAGGEHRDIEGGKVEGNRGEYYE